MHAWIHAYIHICIDVYQVSICIHTWEASISSACSAVVTGRPFAASFSYIYLYLYLYLYLSIIYLYLYLSIYLSIYIYNCIYTNNTCAANISSACSAVVTGLPSAASLSSSARHVNIYIYNLSIYICIHIHIHIHIYTYIYIYIYIYIHIYHYQYIFIYICLYTKTNTNIYLCRQHFLCLFRGSHRPPLRCLLLQQCTQRQTGRVKPYTRYSFTPTLSRAIKPSWYCPLHLHSSHFCNSIVRLLRTIRPPPDPPCVCHTPYNIGLKVLCAPK